MNPTQYPEGALWPAQIEERDRLEREHRAEQQARSKQAREQGIAQARAAGERNARIEAERAAVLQPWERTRDELQMLVRRAANQLQHAEQKSQDNPLNMDRAGDSIAAEKCLVRLQLRLDSHLEVKP